MVVAEWCELLGVKQKAVKEERVEKGDEKPGQLDQVYGGRGKKSGHSEAARQLNLDRKDVERSCKHGRALCMVRTVHGSGWGGVVFDYPFRTHKHGSGWAWEFPEVGGRVLSVELSNRKKDDGCR